MPRNLSHIAGLAFNQPLLLEPAYARVFFCALAQEMGAGRLVDTVSGSVIGRESMGETLALFGEERASTTGRSYDVQDRIAIIPVSGTLVSKMATLRPYSGMTGYNGIVARVMQAITDPGVDGLLLDMDTPGGMVSGAFDAADMIARLRTEKPIWSLANDMHCSAGQLLASACSRRLVTQTARAGSIGVLMAHSDYSGQLEQMGVDVTLIASGTHKTDGNPYEKLPEGVRTEFQSKINDLRQQFAQKVSGYTGMSIDAVLATEAAVYTGQETIEAGLTDELVNNTDALGVMREHLNLNKTRVTGGTMTTTTTQPLADNTGDTGTDATTQALVTTGTDISAAVLSENQRIMGILGCDEAKGRETLAHALAGTPGMSLDDAKRILASGAQSAQVRTQTALDKLMDGAPGAVGSENSISADSNDLMNIPV